MRVTVQSFREFKSSQMANAAAATDELHRYVLAERPSGYDGPSRNLDTYPVLKYVEATGRKFPFGDDIGPYVGNRCLDVLGRRYVMNCSLFVGYSGCCLSTLNVASDHGSTSVVYRGAPHGDFLQSTVNDELREDGFGGVRRSTPRMTPREHQEYRQADFVWVPSEFTRDTLVDRGISQEKIEVFPYGVNVELFEPGVVDTDSFTVLYVGNVSPEKGIHVLLEAFNDLDVPDARLVLIGNPDKRLANEIMGREGVDALGWIDRADLVEWYQRADVFAFPSLADGYPSTVIEALACGCPVIATDRVGTRDFIDRHEAGKIIPPRDSGALVTALEEIHDHPDLCKTMGQNAIAGLQADSLRLADREPLMGRFLAHLNDESSGEF